MNLWEELQGIEAMEKRMQDMYANAEREGLKVVGSFLRERTDDPAPNFGFHAPIVEMSTNKEESE
jgi:hypothetical protein